MIQLQNVIMRYYETILMNMKNFQMLKQER